jgi:kynureninase
MTYSIPTNRAAALALDASDPLRDKAASFRLPEGVIYLDGHSLGPASEAALAAVQATATGAWANGLIRSWNDAGWIDLPKVVGAKLARLIGAQASEVIVADSVSVNLYKLAAAALPLCEAKRIIVEVDEFPTDQYMAQGLCDLAGAEFVRVQSGQGEAAIKEGGVLIKSVVNYRTAVVANMAAHEAAAKAGGGIVIWDLSHATGCVDLDLSAIGAKLATGCTYKYLNGGPGAPAFVYASDAISEQLNSPLSGWFGHIAPFAFDGDYVPAAGAARFAVGTPGVLSLSALDAALDVFDGVSVSALAAKARALGDLCLWWAERLGLEPISPPIGAVRGGHVSLLHSDGYPVVQALIARGIIPDFRAPDAMRFGFSPLYVSFTDVWDAMTALEDILSTRSWDQPQFKVKAAVT